MPYRENIMHLGTSQAHCGGSDMDADKKVVTVLEAAEILGIGKNLCYEAIRRGEIEAIRIGKRIVVSRLAIERMLTGAGRGPVGGQERQA